MYSLIPYLVQTNYSFRPCLFALFQLPFFRRQGLPHNLRDVFDREFTIQVFSLHSIGEHSQAAGTGNRQSVGACGIGFPYSDSCWALLTSSEEVHNEIAATTAAAESIGSIFLHLHQLKPRYTP